MTPGRNPERAPQQLIRAARLLLWVCMLAGAVTVAAGGLAVGGGVVATAAFALHLLELPQAQNKVVAAVERHVLLAAVAGYVTATVGYAVEGRTVAAVVFVALTAAAVVLTVLVYAARHAVDAASGTQVR